MAARTETHDWLMTELTKKLCQMATVYNKKDAKGVARHYATNAVINAPGAPITHRREDVAAVCEKLYKEQEDHLEYTVMNVGGSAPYYHAWCTYVFSHEGKIKETGRSLFVFKYCNGEWEILQENWNPNHEKNARAEQFIEEHARVYNDGDMEAFVQHFTEDCVIMPPGHNVKHGRKEASAVARAHKDFAPKLEHTVVDILGNDPCYVTTNYKLSKDGKEVEHGTCQWVLKLVKGHLQAEHEIWSTDA